MAKTASSLTTLKSLGKPKGCYTLGGTGSLLVQQQDSRLMTAWCSSIDLSYRANIENSVFNMNYNEKQFYPLFKGLLPFYTISIFSIA